MGTEGVQAPSGTVTFLFTDIEGSTRHWGERPDAMSASLSVHDEIIRRSVSEFGGYVFATGGDSFAVAFDRGSAAVRSARAMQERLATADWPGPELRIRVGLHIGEADERGGNYYGPAVNTAARVEAAGHGGQTVLTDALRVAARVSDTTDLGTHSLRDVAEPIHLHQLGDAEFPPLRTLAADVAPPDLPRSWIVVRQPGRAAETVGLDREVTLGREVGRPPVVGHLALGGDSTVSRLHAVLLPRPAGWCVQTANPTNGLFVNGERLAPGAVHLLSNGDELRLGERTGITFHSDAVGDDRLRTETARPIADLDPDERRVLVELCAPILAGDPFTPPADVATIAARLDISENEVDRQLTRLSGRFDVGDDGGDVGGDDRRSRLADAALACGAIGLSDLRSVRDPS